MNERPTSKELAEAGKYVKGWLKGRPDMIQVNGKWYRINKTTTNRKK